MSYLSSDNMGVQSGLVATLFIIFGSVCCLILFFVFLIHTKYEKFRKNLFSVIMGCLICEYVISVHFLWTGFSSLVIGSEKIKGFACDFNAFLIFFFVHCLFFYHITTILLILTGRLPYKTKMRNKKKTEKERVDKRKVFTIIHVLSVILSVIQTFFYYLADAYGMGVFGSCFVKLEADRTKSILLGIPFITYVVLSVTYFIMNFWKNYSNRYPTLKNYPFYCILTALCWLVEFIGFPFIMDNSYNSISISGDLLAMVVIAYLRVMNNYIQTVLKEGDSNNKFVQAVLIFFCLETKADVKSFSRRQTVKLQSRLESDFEIN